VYASGDLCLDILQNRWSPTYDVAAILTSYDPLPVPVYLSFSVFSVLVPPHSAIPIHVSYLSPLYLSSLFFTNLNMMSLDVMELIF
jgi:hypothetical protein